MDILGTDMTKVAAAYAAFAGVLAGFVFAVMGYLVGNRKPKDDPTESSDVEIALSWSVLAFVGLSDVSAVVSSTAIPACKIITSHPVTGG